MTKSYHTINGRIRAETSGGVRTGYLPDAQGNVTATVQDGAIVNTYRYKPSGALLDKTGNGDDPAFLWNGTHGYRNSPDGEIYVRHRHYNTSSGMWTSKDYFWPGEHAYIYVMQSPTNYFDYSGMAPVLCNDEELLKALKDMCEKFNTGLKNGLGDAVKSCMKEKFGGLDSLIDPVLKCIGAHCGPASTCILCPSVSDYKDTAGLPAKCLENGLNPCFLGTRGFTPAPLQAPTGTTPPAPGDLPGPISVPPGQAGCRDLNQQELDCESELRKAMPDCKTVIVICKYKGQNGKWTSEGEPIEAGLTLLHELGHACTRLAHVKDHKGFDFIEQLACCMCKALYPNDPSKCLRSCDTGGRK
jgi:RHS repeat-associated protein